MIIYLHGFDATSPGNHEKVMQLQLIDDDVRFIHYSTIYPRHDMSHLLKEVKKQMDMSRDPNPLICGVGLGGYWSERIGFLCGIKQVIFNPNLHPEIEMQNKIERPEEFQDIATKCVSEFRRKNSAHCLCILSQNDEVRDNQLLAKELEPYYPIIWDERETHKFKNIVPHLKRIKAFKDTPIDQA